MCLLSRRDRVRMARLVCPAVVCTLLIGLPWSTLKGNNPPSVKLALQFKPLHPVKIDTPLEADFEKCEVKVERKENSSGWVVLDPHGQPLRRYIDTNADNVVDQWRYYQSGMEVYRDIDSDFDKKVDQSRWFNTAGTRWGVDNNQDGNIDTWKRLSAEEASQIAVLALATRDVALLRSILVTDDDLESLGIETGLADRIRQAVSDVESRFQQTISDTKSINAKTQWLRFDSEMPRLINTDEGKASKDLTIYQNVMAIVDNDGKRGFVSLGEMLLVGSTWKLTALPRPMEGETVQVSDAGVLMQPTTTTPRMTDTVAGTVTPETQKLLEQLRAIDQQSPPPNAGSKQLVEYNTRRAEVLNKLIEASQTPAEREQWTRQLIDGIAAATQSGGYSAGIDQLKRLEARIAKSSPQSQLTAYVTYRRLLAEYSEQLQGANSEKIKEIQEWWLKQLAGFVQQFPQGEDTSEAMLQLAITQEFSGKTKEAQQWYQQLASAHPDTTAGRRAQGALRRFGLRGQQLQLAGDGLQGGTINIDQYAGKAVLVIYWATWCTPCTEDLPQIRALYEQYQPRGFEIIGINLDVDTAPVGEYLRKHQVKWPQIYQPGGMESELAHQYGIISLPTMFLVDKEGKVVSRSISVSDLKAALPGLL